MSDVKSSVGEQQVARSSGMGIRDYILKNVGFLPKDAYSWLYTCRGLYQMKEYNLVAEGLQHCLRNENTKKEAQHLYAFSLLHTNQFRKAAIAFEQSVKMGNDTDWQPLIELLLDEPGMTLSSKK